MPNTLYVDAGYMTRMRRCWAYVRLVAVLDVSDGAFAHFDGSVQAVDANEVVVGRHRPLHLDIRALADAEPDEWLCELGRRKIDSLVVDDDDVFEMLSSI